MRTFQTTFDSDSNSTKYGYRAVSRLMCLAKQLDRLAPRRRRQRHALSAKIENLKTDFHWQLAHQLCRSYEHIMIPIFRVSQMVNRFKRKIRSETVRQMLHWSHFAFRQRLHHKGEEWQTKVHEVSEHYTSKSCGNCGWSTITWRERKNSSVNAVPTVAIAIAAPAARSTS